MTWQDIALVCVASFLVTVGVLWLLVSDAVRRNGDG